MNLVDLGSPIRRVYNIRQRDSTSQTKGSYVQTHLTIPLQVISTMKVLGWKDDEAIPIEFEGIKFYATTRRAFPTAEPDRQGNHWFTVPKRKVVDVLKLEHGQEVGFELYHDGSKFLLKIKRKSIPKKKGKAKKKKK